MCYVGFDFIRYTNIQLYIKILKIWSITFKLNISSVIIFQKYYFIYVLC